MVIIVILVNFSLLKGERYIGNFYDRLLKVRINDKKSEVKEGLILSRLSQWISQVFALWKINIFCEL